MRFAMSVSRMVLAESLMVIRAVEVGLETGVISRVTRSMGVSGIGKILRTISDEVDLVWGHLSQLPA